MIYLYYGTDREKTADAARQQVGILESRHGTRSNIFDADAWNSESIKALAASESLFNERNIIYLRYITEEAAHRPSLLETLPFLEQSTHDVVIVEGFLTKELREALETAAAHTEKYDLPHAKDYTGAREIHVSHPMFTGYSIYSFSDAFGSRNKRALWVEYQTALAAGLSAEELFWKLSWQLKQMLIVTKMTPADKTDMKPFIINKAKGFLRNYKPEELPLLSMKLVDIYHKSRRGLTDFDTSLERFVLEL